MTQFFYQLIRGDIGLPINLARKVLCAFLHLIIHLLNIIFHEMKWKPIYISYFAVCKLSVYFILPGNVHYEHFMTNNLCSCIIFVVLFTYDRNSRPTFSYAEIHSHRRYTNFACLYVTVWLEGAANWALVVYTVNSLHTRIAHISYGYYKHLTPSKVYVYM